MQLLRQYMPTRRGVDEICLLILLSVVSVMTDKDYLRKKEEYHWRRLPQEPRNLPRPVSMDGTPKKYAPHQLRSDRIRNYAGVLVPGCFYQRTQRDDCKLYQQSLGKEETCESTCEYLWHCRKTLLRLFNRRIMDGPDTKFSSEYKQNLEEPLADQPSLSDWL